MKIQDATGSAFGLRIDERNRASTDAISQTVEHYANFAEGQSWTLTLEQTPTGAGDYFFFFENTDTINYVIKSLDYRVASAEQVEIVMNPEVSTLSGGTDITPTNLNTSSAKVITGTIQAGNNITGISNGSTAYKLFLTSTETKNFNFDQDIIIAPGGKIAFLVVAGSVQINMDINVFKSEF